MASDVLIERVELESVAAVSAPSSPVAEIAVTDGRRFSNLRGVQWRIDLGILPSKSSIDDLRLTTADSRRRYARLRQHLLVVVDPHERRSNSSEIVIDDPLSQNPDSRWGQFFQTAELKRTLDQDLSLLCKDEQGSYLQTSGFQRMLRRILLLWSLEHPECGYRQGMLELLTPLLYVLQADRDYVSKTRKYYEEQVMTDDFCSCKFDQDFTDESKDFPTWKIRNFDELDPNVQEIVSMTDAYGAEGELGVVISSYKYLEHDAYSMFDVLMGMAIDFFLPPMIESCSVWYRLLSVVDPALLTHLVEIRVEPQYFALRWLRVLFGREFALDNLLIIWDNIFQHDHNNLELGNALFSSSRGAFVSAFAVSMIIYLRLPLLASENTTSCLQKLLNFPNDIVMGKLLDNAKSLLVLAMDHRFNSMDFDPFCVDLSGSVSPTSPLSSESGSYWEGRWRMMNKDSETKRNNNKKVWSESFKWRLSDKLKAISDEDESRICNSKERKPPLWGKFQWLWKLRKNNFSGSSDSHPVAKVSSSRQGHSLGDLGHSIVQHIEVIESCLEEEPCKESAHSGSGYNAVMTALKELRKTSKFFLQSRD